jgi:murein DD-endopeptidase MepM/ murein hydrolase activator NlpD
MRPIIILIIIFSVLICHSACTFKLDPNKEIPEFLIKFPADSFAYPTGETDYITEKRDGDLWYNAQDFGENRHLGEDWNKTTGGNTDCGEPVYAAADGQIVFAADAGAGWGNVLIIEHTAEDGTKVQSLYGHLETILKTAGNVSRRELIGTIGSANGRYMCHLHFEIRRVDCPMWNQAGNGYADDRRGWIDPSEFIEKHRKRSSGIFAFW